VRGTSGEEEKKGEGKREKEKTRHLPFWQQNAVVEKKKKFGRETTKYHIYALR
jgi:hypothetical protein